MIIGFTLFLCFVHAGSQERRFTSFLLPKNGTVETLKGKALEEIGTIRVQAQYELNGRIHELNSTDIYFYSPHSVFSKAFCTEGVKIATDVKGIATCSLKLGFVVGTGKFRASLNSPLNDHAREGESIEEGWCEIGIEITSKIYWGAYVTIVVLLTLIVIVLGISILLWVYVVRKPTGTAKMQEIAKYIASGASGFLRVQYVTIGLVSLPVAVILFFVFLFRSRSPSDPPIHNAVYGLIVSVSFLVGVVCSAVSGYVGMYAAVRANIRVAAAAMRSYRECVNVCIRGGSFAAFGFVNLSVIGVFVMFCSVFIFVPQRFLNPIQMVTIIVGFSFGASFAALFAQLGGGIYTKAADIGADIVGKVESKIPEDDVRNPAVVADLVGDNVGDCAGRGADLFESISANCFGTMILGATLAYRSYPNLDNVIMMCFFPMLVLAFGMVASFVGLMFVQVKDVDLSKNLTDEQVVGVKAKVEEYQQMDDADELERDAREELKKARDRKVSEVKEDEEVEEKKKKDLVLIEEEDEGKMEEVKLDERENVEEEVEVQGEEDEKDKFASSGFYNPVYSIGLGFLITFGLNVVFFVIICAVCFYSKLFPRAWWLYSLCGLCGISISFAFIFITVYYTDYQWRPTRSIAKASETGAATNIIQGLAVGFESTFASVLVVCFGILFCYYMGTLTGISDLNGRLIGGLYGIGVGTMGILSTSAFILAMDTFGPIADNAGGIVEMSGLCKEIREVTDRLDAVGNTTKALTKGYAIGTACLAGCLLFFAFLDTISNYTGVEINDINISKPEVFVGGLLGAAVVFLFISITFGAVSRTAIKICNEVRRQFRENPGILEYKEQPDYKKCVSFCTKHSLLSMIFPGLLATVSPIAVGVLFRIVGYFVNDRFMGVYVSTSFIIVATIVAVLMGMLLNNSGGSWDNAKKYIETGKFGGKGSVAHEGSIVGDTVGDPFKDTAGPSLHVLIKLIATVALVIGPMWVNSKTMDNTLH